MKYPRSLALFGMIMLYVASFAFAQAPAITAVVVKDTGCVYKVGVSTQMCNIGPGMTLVVDGSNFGAAGGGLSLCDCMTPTVVKWTPSHVTAIVNAVTPNAGVSLETQGGLWSNGVAYTALAPVITSIVVGNCTYIPNQSATLCLITPGTQFTINGSYFGPQTPYNVVWDCNGCTNATVNSWNPNWSTSPSPYNNQVVATATETYCGYTIALYTGTFWSNHIPYTAC